LSFSPPSRAAFIVAAAVVSLSACGRRGDLEPPTANVVQTPAKNHSFDVHRPSEKITPPKKDFALDPLLQ
jgi:predicted small lipoprotein YifL